jgi:uncharacterized protein YqfA (UPF0365 family)
MSSQFLLFLLFIVVAVIAWKSGPVVALWLQARRAGAPLSLLWIWRLYFRNVPLQSVVRAHIMAVEAGVDVPLTDLTSHALAGGDSRVAMQAYIETIRAGTPIDFSHVCELELSEPEAEEALVR